MSRGAKQEPQNEYRDDDDESQSGSPEDVSDISVSDLSDEYELMDNGKRKNKSNNKPKKKIKKNRFVEEEAEEASEDDRDLDDDVRRKPEMKDKEYDNQFNQMLQRRQGKDVIKNIEERFKDLGEEEIQQLYESDGLQSSDDDVELPKLEDPKIWRVGCTLARENDAAMSLMFKYSNHKEYDQPLEIVSAFSLKKYPGVVFIEANFDWQVIRAIEGLYDLRYRKIEIVEPQQCSALFKPIEQEPIPIENGQWVRIKRHQIYEGDLGRVLTIDHQKRLLSIKLIPRERRQIASFLDKNTDTTTIKKVEDITAISNNMFITKGEYEQELEEKPIPKNTRWSIRTLKMIEQKRYVRGPKISIKYDKNVDSQERNENQSIFYYPNTAIERDRCKKDGFVLIHTEVYNLVWVGIQPKLEEIAYFYPDLKNIRTVMPRLQKSLKVAMGPQTTMTVGDRVTIDKEYPGIRFTIKEVLPDGKLVLSHTSKTKNENEQKVYEHLAHIDSVKQIFMKYQEIIVISGPNTGAQGVIIDIKKNTAVISLMQGIAIECLFTDLQTQHKVQGYDQGSVTNPYKAQVQLYQNHNQDKSAGVARNDLVKFGIVDNEIGCVMSIQKNEVTILDLTNKVQKINLMTVTGKMNTRNNVAKNIHQHEIRRQDLIVILDGFYKGCKASVIHVYHDILFLHNGKFDHTQGIIVEKVHNCVLISSMNGGGNDHRRFNRPIISDDAEPVQDIIGQYLTIAKGRWSGYRGMVTQVQQKTVIVQLTAKNLTVKVLKSDLHHGSTIPHHPSMTPHYTANVGDGMGTQKQNLQVYQSPYVYGQTPSRDFYQ